MEEKLNIAIALKGYEATNKQIKTLEKNLYPIILISLRLFFPRRSFIRKVGLLFLEHKKGTLPLGSAPTT